MAFGIVVGSTVAAPALPPPYFARSVDIGLVFGTVIVHPVRGQAFRLGPQDRTIPVGSQIDTTHGEVDLRSAYAPETRAASATISAVQDAQFSKGLFRVLQRSTQGGLTVMQLISPATTVRRVCATTGSDAFSASRLSARVISTLDATDHGGQFRTRGRYSAATVRGTSWVTIDRCDGTLTVVRRGTVDVYDFPRRLTVVLHAGQRYLARRPLSGS